MVRVFINGDRSFNQERASMTRGDFYERKEVIHEVVEAKRSKICYGVITDLINDSAIGMKKRILDIGCGDGSFIIKLKKRCETFGVDISQSAVKMAREAGINAYEADVSSQELPFQDEYFDIIYMGDVIEHLTNPDFAINEVHRVLKPNGFLVLSTPNLASWINRLLLLLGMQPLFSEVSTAKTFGRGPKSYGFVPVGHLRLFTYKALKEFLVYYRFDIVKAKGSDYEGLSNALKSIDKILSKIPSLSSNIIIIARKSN
jgi:ubiquinone/menaquinone biosynthesis C-methylase UbiE